MEKYFFQREAKQELTQLVQFAPLATHVMQKINHPIGKACSAFFRLKQRVFQNRELKTGTKRAVYRAVALPTLLHGNKCWTVYRMHIRILEALHQRQLRRTLGIEWSDSFSNRITLERAKYESMEHLVTRNILRWLGHVQRMEMPRLPKQVHTVRRIII